MLPIELYNGVAYPVDTQKVFRDSGRYSLQVCEGGDYNVVNLKPIAAEFSKFMASRYATTAMTWHSIVYNEQCANSAFDAGASIGVEYMELSLLLKG